MTKIQKITQNKWLAIIFWIGDKKKYSLDGQVRLIGAKLDVIKVGVDGAVGGWVVLYMQASISEETDMYGANSGASVCWVYWYVLGFPDSTICGNLIPVKLRGWYSNGGEANLQGFFS